MPNVLDHLARDGAHASPKQLLEASLAAFAHLAAAKDRDELARCLGRMAPNRNLAIPAGPPRAAAFEPLSQEQRLVLRAYGHLLALVRPADDARARLAQLDAAMGFTDGLALFLHRALSHAKARELVGGAGGIEAILEASAPLRARIDEAVADARHAGPFTRKHPIAGLAASEYEHPHDRAALAVLEKTPGLSLLVRKLNELGFDRYMRVKHTGSNVRVNERSMPDLHALFRHACEVLENLPRALPVRAARPPQRLHRRGRAPDRDPQLLGGGRLRGGRAALRHRPRARAREEPARPLPPDGDRLPLIGEWLASATLGIGRLVTKGVEFALLDWMRKSEMTCDRAGLLACQDVDATTTAMMKIGGLPQRYYAGADPAHFAQQAREFQELDTSKLDRLAKFLMTLSSNHPWTVIRAAELQKSIAAGEYERILTAHGVPREVALRPSRARSEAGEAPQAEPKPKRNKRPGAERPSA